MTRVDFYVLEEPSERAFERLVFRLVEKAWSNGKRVHVHCQDDDAARACDDYLWTCHDTGFVPHALLNEDAAGAVTIGCEPAAPPAPEVLVNLAAAVPECFSQFDRVMETTGHDDAGRAAARERYRFYQTRGYAIETHTIRPQ